MKLTERLLYGYAIFIDRVAPWLCLGLMIWAIAWSPYWYLGVAGWILGIFLRVGD